MKQNRAATVSVRGNAALMRQAKDRGFTFSSIFRYGLDFFSRQPEAARAWELEQDLKAAREKWERGTKKGRPPPGPG